MHFQVSVLLNAFKGKPSLICSLNVDKRELVEIFSSFCVAFGTGLFISSLDIGILY